MVLVHLHLTWPLNRGDFNDLSTKSTQTVSPEIRHRMKSSETVQTVYVAKDSYEHMKKIFKKTVNFS